MIQGTREPLLGGKRAIVTGSSRGIGRAIALECAREGADVLVNYKTGREEAEAVAREITELGRRSVAVQASVNDRRDVQQMIAAAVDRFGGLDVLVNNAGIVADGLLVNLNESAWDSVLETDLKGVYHCCQAAMAVMIRQRSGSIVNISSLSGISGRRGQCNYAAAKGGMIAFSKSLAQEAGYFGIRVNAVAPGPIATRIIDALPADTFDLDLIPLRRLGEPEEVARTVVFLASEMASYVTGCVLHVNGGLYM